MSYLRKKLNQKAEESSTKFFSRLLINITQAVATATLIITMGLLACSIAGIHLPSHAIFVGWLLCFVISSILIM